MATYAESPFGDCCNDADIRLRLVAEEHLDRPVACPDDIHDMIRLCRNFIAECRPSFAAVVEKLKTSEHPSQQPTSVDDVPIPQYARSLVPCLSHRTCVHRLDGFFIAQQNMMHASIGTCVK